MIDDRAVYEHRVEDRIFQLVALLPQVSVPTRAQIAALGCVAFQVLHAHLVRAVEQTVVRGVWNESRTFCMECGMASERAAQLYTRLLRVCTGFSSAGPTGPMGQ